ncbi:hypothetical protein BGZ89_006335 [Linnemannia elongata]|nr:hypothetical protein BGZ89_006335 [Linnemannia elongata]
MRSIVSRPGPSSKGYDRNSFARNITSRISIEFSSIQIRHPEFDQCNGDEDGGTSKTGDAVDGDCWGHKGVVFYFGDGG